LTANSQLVPNNWKYQTAKNFLESFANNSYYVFIGDHTLHSNTELQPLEDIELDEHHARRNMIQGKRVNSDDVALMIRDIPYESNKVFDMYDDLVDLKEKDFYTVVNASSYYHVFKCLDNNMGANSTVEPNFADISGANTAFYRTSDGYVWKYMYSVSNARVLKWKTSLYFPVVANSEVSNGAIVGAIDVINIDNPGLRYNNYLTDTFATLDCRVDDDVTYRLTNSVASQVNGFYTGCSLYLSSGPGSGQHMTINNYFCNASGNFIVLEDLFAEQPFNGTSYEIYPRVEITGSGSETVTAEARALVNSTAGNSIYRVEMFERGADYNYFIANVVANAVVGVTRTAELRPIISPPKGHGFDAAAELLSSAAEISLKFSNSESNTILTSNKFQQVGVIKNPKFANVAFELANTTGLFLVGEKVEKINPFSICTGATINTTSHMVTAANGNFLRRVAANDSVYLTDNDSRNQFGIINNVINSTAFNLTVNGFFSCTTVEVMTANTGACGWVDRIITSSLIYCTNVGGGEIVANDFVIGVQSGAIATINAVSHNDVVKNYETFIQLYKFTGELTFNNFAENEIVVQTDPEANGLLHCAIVDGGDITIYTSNQVGIFEINKEVTGVNSGAIALINNALLPELVYNTGTIIYLENMDAITRQNNQTEIFQLIFNF
jgi:hypothetical protein